MSNSRKIAPLTPEEIVKMKAVCKLAARTLEYIAKYVQVGVTTFELDQIVEDYTRTNNATSAPLGYHGYPKSICTSINSVVCHGVPDSTKLKQGDIINIDITPFKDGFYGDCSATFMVGVVSDQARQLVQTAELARDKGILEVRPGGYTGDIGFATEKFVTRKGYTCVKEIGGHGIGRVFHAEPFVPAVGKKGKGEQLTPWHCITVEPMINEGVSSVKEFDIPGSTVKYYETTDGKLSAQFEHTVLITDAGYDILTLP